MSQWEDVVHDEDQTSQETFEQEHDPAPNPDHADGYGSELAHVHGASHGDGYPGAYVPEYADEDLAEESTPFGGVTQVDGLVYSGEIVSPELQWQHQQTNVPMPPVRERPLPPMRQNAELWKPGPDPVPAKPASSSAPLRVLKIALLPMLVLSALAWLVHTIMQAYGL